MLLFFFLKPGHILVYQYMSKCGANQRMHMLLRVAERRECGSQANPLFDSLARLFVRDRIQHLLVSGKQYADGRMGLRVSRVSRLVGIRA